MLLGDPAKAYRTPLKAFAKHSYATTLSFKTVPKELNKEIIRRIPNIGGFEMIIDY